MSKTKVCYTCGLRKERRMFYSHDSTKDGLRSSCKFCQKKAYKEWVKNNPEKVDEYHKSPRQKEYMKAYHKNKMCNPKYRTGHQKSSRKYYYKNRDDIREKQNARRKQLRANKERLADYLIAKYGGTPCLDCGGEFPWCAMDFDHRPGEIKVFKIGGASAQKATPGLIAKAEREIKKCDLVCANCHRVRTEKRANDE